MGYWATEMHTAMEESSYAADQEIQGVFGAEPATLLKPNMIEKFNCVPIGVPRNTM